MSWRLVRLDSDWREPVYRLSQHGRHVDFPRSAWPPPIYRVRLNHRRKGNIHLAGLTDDDWQISIPNADVPIIAWAIWAGL